MIWLLQSNKYWDRLGQLCANWGSVDFLHKPVVVMQSNTAMENGNLAELVSGRINYQ
jgi:hypothetical protein